MRCETVEKMLDAHRTSEIGRERRGAVERHLAGCPECLFEYRTIRRFAARAARLRLSAPKTILRNLREIAADRYGSIGTAIGKVWIGFNARGITMIHLGIEGDQAFEKLYRNRLGRTIRRGEIPADYSRLVRAAASGGDAGRAPIDLSALAPFEQEVLQQLRKIPRGEVRPYLWLARRAGKPQAARAVGNVMARNPIPLILPCHRVVPAGGGVGSYAFGGAIKRALLKREGVRVDELDRMAREGVRFVGCKSTGIFCYPTCRAARRIQSENRVPLSGVPEAEKAGYRACRLCQP